MAEATYLCVKRDSTVWVVSFDSDKNTCQLYDIHAWITKGEAAQQGHAVSDWAEQNSPVIEAIYPYDSSTGRADFREAEIIEVSELMDDIRDF